MADQLSSEAIARRSSSPAVVADTIAKAVTTRRPKTRYAVGMGAKPLIFLRRWLSDRSFDTLMRRVSGIPAA